MPLHRYLHLDIFLDIYFVQYFLAHHIYNRLRVERISMMVENTVPDFTGIHMDLNFFHKIFEPIVSWQQHLIHFGEELNRRTIQER